MTFNESDLIALHLRELSPRRARALQRAIAVDPALAAESEAIAYTLRAFPPTPAPLVDAALLDRTWNALRPSLLVLPEPAPARLWRVPLTAAAGLALTAAAVFWISLLTAGHPSKTQPAGNPTIAQTHSQPSPIVSTAPADQQAAPSPHKTIALNVTPTINFPSTTKQHAATSSVANSGHGAPIAFAQEQTTYDKATATTQTTNSIAAPGAPQPPPTAAADNSVLAANQSSAIPAQPSPADSAGLPAHRARPVYQRETDVSIGAFADVTADRSITASNGSYSTQSIRPAAGVLVSFHQQLRRAAGYQISAAYNRTNFEYTTNSAASSSTVTSPPTYISGVIPAKVYELSATYVVAGPRSHRFFTHAGAGGAMLAFIPDASPTDSRVFRPAGLATISAGIHIKHHWSLRAEYRALFFRGPDFHNTNVNVPVISRTTISSQPTLGLDYSFDPRLRPGH